jgi:regulator of nucleoside diphosphate kinase
MTQATMYVSELDRVRLENLIELVRREGDTSNTPYVNKLAEELEFAEVVPPENIPPDVVTMRSKVRLKDLDTGEETTYSIVFPTEAISDEGKISVLAPLATALLGSVQGSTVEFQAPGRMRRLQILEILYQPEAAGDLDL